MIYKVTYTLRGQTTEIAKILRTEVLEDAVEQFGDLTRSFNKDMYYYMHLEEYKLVFGKEVFVRTVKSDYGTYINELAKRNRNRDSFINYLSNEKD